MIILTIFFIACSCNNEKSIDEIHAINKTTYNELINKYDAIIIDSLNQYTYSIQETLIDNNRKLAFTGKISDIYRVDSNYVINAYTTINSKNYTAQIRIDKNQLVKMNYLLKYNDNKNNEGCFIIKVSSVKSRCPSLELENEEGNEDNEPYIEIGGFGEEKVLIFKGELLDFYINQDK